MRDRPTICLFKYNDWTSFRSPVFSLVMRWRVSDGPSL